MSIATLCLHTIDRSCHAVCDGRKPGGSCRMSLPEKLLSAVHELRLQQAVDPWQQAEPAEPAEPIRGLKAGPSIDLAVLVFTPGSRPSGANVLFSREHPQGWVAEFGPNMGAVQNLRFDADPQDSAGQSIAWLPGADWDKLSWQPLSGPGQVHGPRFVAPYPASLLKLMVAVGVALAVDEGLCGWPEVLEPMITVSDNAATDTCVALLHRLGWLSPAADNRLNRQFVAWGLPTLQINRTQPGGGWRNADGAGVGQIHMTAWDTVRLLWLIDETAPPAPWLPPDTPGLSPGSRAHLHALLRRQQLDEVLSSGSLRGTPGWVPGGPDAPAFAHKTGTTDNYASDAGIVNHGGLHYIVAVLTSLGRRYAPDERCATTWRLPALGAAVASIVAQLHPDV